MQQSTTGQKVAAVGPQLRRLRRGLDLNQVDLARLAQVCQASVSRVENGADVTPGIVRRIVDALLAAEARAKSR